MPLRKVNGSLRSNAREMCGFCEVKPFLTNWEYNEHTTGNKIIHYIRVNCNQGLHKKVMVQNTCNI
jgi:hypothetical protein